MDALANWTEFSRKAAKFAKKNFACSAPSRDIREPDPGLGRSRQLDLVFSQSRHVREEKLCVLCAFA
jgi:hypothetical protein